MPVPAAVWLIVEAALLAVSIYEIHSVLDDFYEGLDNYKKNVDQAKQELEKLLENLKEEIDKKIEEKEEVGILLAAAAADKQREVTRNPTGRGAGSPLIEAAIEQKIPFRKVISEVCRKAENMPVLQLRKKPGIKVADIAKAKRKALEALLATSVEHIADVDLDAFVVVRLKQLAASLLFEFVDYALDWKSPMKAEVSFGPPKSGYTDHPLEAGSATQLKRVGAISPFYPVPAPNDRRGSISADLIIPDYRKKRCDKNNIFALVEIKFQSDKIELQQFQQYEKLLDAGAQQKTASHPVRYKSQPVTSGGRLSLFRYPEDRWPDEEDAENKDQKRSHQPRRKG